MNESAIEAIFNPHSEAYLVDTAAQWRALYQRGRMVWYEPWQAWIMTQLPDIMDCWKREYLSSDFYDWEFAPERPPEDQWSNFERAMIGHSLLADHDHHRLVRRIAAPAFSRNVVDKIQERIEPDVKALFEGLGKPAQFNYVEAIADHIPFISITRMVGIPERYWDDIKRVIMTFTEAWNPTISEEQRAAARADSNRAIDILLEVIRERRSAPQKDDFLSVLLNVESEQPAFEEWDIVTLILALIGAGSDTTLVAQQWTAYALLKFPEQRAWALASPENFANTFNEVQRWSLNSKMGFARYAPEDMEILGEQVRKGQMVLMMPHLKNVDPAFFPEPEKFDAQRVFDPDVLFGYGPRFCIGASLAKRQLYLTMSELFRCFPNAGLACEPQRDGSDHNAVVLRNLIVETNCDA
jgi:cytochrome P450